MAGIVIPERLQTLLGKKKRKPIGAIIGGTVGGMIGTNIGATQPRTLSSLANAVRRYAAGQGIHSSARSIGLIAGKRIVPVALLTAALGAVVGNKLQR